VIALQIEQAMAEEGLTKAEMAARMKTSRTQIERLLDPQNNRSSSTRCSARRWQWVAR
jgi:DNA-binding transcriptional regulator LsrR (DeoR family)